MSTYQLYYERIKDIAMNLMRFINTHTAINVLKITFIEKGLDVVDVVLCFDESLCIHNG